VRAVRRLQGEQRSGPLPDRGRGGASPRGHREPILAARRRRPADRSALGGHDGPGARGGPPGGFLRVLGAAKGISAAPEWTASALIGRPASPSLACAAVASGPCSDI